MGKILQPLTPISLLPNLLPLRWREPDQTRNHASHTDPNSILRRPRYPSSVRRSHKKTRMMIRMMAFSLFRW